MINWLCKKNCTYNTQKNTYNKIVCNKKIKNNHESQRYKIMEKKYSNSSVANNPALKTDTFVVFNCPTRGQRVRMHGLLKKMRWKKKISIEIEW